MDIRGRIAIAGGLFAMLFSSAAQAEVSVQFVEPTHFTDSGDYGGHDGRRGNLQQLERHLETLAARCVAPRESLELRVFDVDLAGRQEWWRGAGYDIRIMRESSWPRMDIGFILRDAEGRTVSAAREQVSDMNYLMHAGLHFSPEPLAYDKAMLTEWFERRFCKDSIQAHAAQH